jgi:drug/metabolite transporter (DMT)-like permease
MFCTYYVIKYFPLVYVSIVANTAPLLIAFFAFLIYRERLTSLDIGVLLVSFLGVAVLITGSLEKETPSEETMQTASIVLPLILLIAIPFN